MQIHRVRGSDLQDALKRARRVHGERALVVSHETLSSGGVAVAVARPAGKQQRVGRVFTDEPPVTPHEFPREDEARRESHVGLREVAALLTENGASKTLVDRVLSKIDRADLEDHHAIDVAAEVIGGMFTIARAPRVPGRTRIMTALGPSGGGKTTALIKIAYRLLTAERDVAFATLDTDRVGANEKLMAWSDRFGMPCYALRDAEQLNELLNTETPPEALLLDTTGTASIDNLKLQALFEGSVQQQVQNFLVLPATLSRSAQSMQVEVFKDSEISGAVVTKLDETRDGANTLEHILDEGLPVAFLSDGQDVARNFHRASSDCFADILLRGRIS